MKKGKSTSYQLHNSFSGPDPSVEQIVKRGALLRSSDVDANNDHKLWWADVVRTDDGKFRVVTYAQLFGRHSGEVKAGEKRTYWVNGTYLTKEDAQVAMTDKYRHKEKNRSYEYLSSRENGLITASDESIATFLEKYGSILS